MKKRLLSVLLTICMLVGLLATGVSAAEETASGQCGDDVYWSLDADGVLTIYGEGEMWDEPGITDEAGAENILSVVIEEGVTSIGTYAFSACENLSTVTIADSVTSIGSRAFQYCSSLTEVVIPDGVTQISDRTFRYCSSLTRVVLPDSVTSVGDYAFYDCSALTSLTIPDSVEPGRNAFYNCGGLADEDGFVIFGNVLFGYYGDADEVVIPDSVTAIDSTDGGANTSLTIGAGVSAIEYDAFYFGDALTDITVSEDNAYYTSADGVLFTADMRTLVYYPKGKSESSYTVPDGVTEIAMMAFYGCEQLESVTFPDSLELVGEQAFYNCTALTDVDTKGAAAENCAFTGCTGLADSDGFIIVGTVLYGYTGDETDIVIPDGITRVDPDAFNGGELSSGSVLTSVSFPDSVTSIGDWSFANQENLTSVTIGDGVKEIDQGAFYNCPALTDLDLGSSVEYIDSWAFSWIGISSLTMPESLTGTGEAAFGSCMNLETVDLGSTLTTLSLDLFSECYNLKTVTGGENVTYIDQGVFWLCSSLESFTFYEGLTYIGTVAFEGTALTSVTIPASVEYIDVWAFGDAENLTEIIFKSASTEFHEQAFANTPGDGAWIIDFSFADDDDSGVWYWEYIYAVYNEGVISGYAQADGSSIFNPAGTLTRAEAAKIIAAALDLETAETASASFTDTASHWANAYIEACVEAGIINGYSDGTFKPDETVTRAELAKMIAVAYDLSGTADLTFLDETESSPWSWAGTYIYACVDAGVINGYASDAGSTFLPDNTVTRGEAAAMIARVLGLAD